MTPVGPADPVGRGDPVGVAERLADEVLFPLAAEIERAGVVPVGVFDRLAAAGFYGLRGPVEAGGMDATAADQARVIEAFAGGAPAAAFVWLQHQGVVATVAASGNAELRQRWLGPLCRGERRAGVALGGALPGPPRLRARPVPGGVRLAGESPWLTGWRYLDTVQVLARDPDDTLLRVMIDARAGPALRVTPMRLAAVDAAELATRAAATLATATGADAVLAGGHAERLVREAMFLLVFGSRPAIRQALLDELARPGRDSGDGAPASGAGHSG
jgi:hypothetical protein